MAWGVLALIGLHSMLEYPLWYGPFQMAVGLCLWLLWLTRPGLANLQGLESALVKHHRPFDKLRVNGTSGTNGRKGLGWVGLVLLCGIGFAAWDYHRISQIYLPLEQRSAAYREHTLEKIKSSWLFQNQVRFAELTITPLTRDNAQRLNAMAHEVLHYSPEARVVEKLIESARVLGREDEALFFEERLRAAYPRAR
jgi:hypothetical protein